MRKTLGIISLLLLLACCNASAQKVVAYSDSLSLGEGNKLPSFPGGMQMMEQYISDNVRYPKDAVEKGIEGSVICTFVVMPDGSITNAKVSKGLNPLLDAEALRVVNAMPKWNPGMRRGKAVRSNFTLPVIFNIKRLSKESATAGGPNTVATETERMPSFPGGVDALVAYIKDNLHYPEAAEEKNVQGKVVCSFYVNTDGSLSEIVVTQSVDPLLDNEAIRLVSSMPKWIPGVHNGKPVRVKYTMPINFRITQIVEERVVEKKK